VQAACFSDLATLAAPAQLVSVAAHKVGGPKGVGALVARRGAEPAPILHGGGQERDLRSGTHDLAGIVGFAAALAAAATEREEAAARVAALRDRLVDGLLAAVPGAVESGRRQRKGPAHAHVRFPGVEAEELLVLLDREGICASAGSSCASGATEPSHVLRAMGVPPAEAAGAVRFSLGWCSTEADVARALEVVPKAVAALGGGVNR
jgi:cysteine desulfurase